MNHNTEIRRDHRIPTDTQNINKDDRTNTVLIESIVQFINGDYSNVHVLDQFFEVPEGKSFAGKSLESVLQFLMTSYYQVSDLTLSFKALYIISMLLELENLDFSFLMNDQFLIRSIGLLSSKHKVMAYNVLSTLRKVINLSDDILNRCLQLGYLDGIIQVTDFSQIRDFNETTFIKSYQEAIVSVFDLSFLNLEAYNDKIWNIAFEFIKNSNSLIIGGGLKIMQVLINRSYKPNINEEFYQRILELSNAKASILDLVFGIIANHHFPDNEQFTVRLFEDGFYMQILNRIETDSELTKHFFRFLDAMTYIPPDDDPMFGKLIEILHYGTIYNRIAIIQYIYAVSFEKSNDFLVFLAENNILAVITEFINSRVQVIGEILYLSEKVINSVIAMNAEAVLNSTIDDYLESIQNMIGEYNGVYDPLIFRILNNFCERE
ncbi:hypothetical protein TRFO_39322 [Tritrichomonas foetus]|uniref:SPIN90/Ldb17 leucine-rich domain-containing protein n=1 Tax=Tritrichomonas foetus TaxID=1144522 RepID=A0A1J4J790_9EUKA|nr:hypothetical protein TRFO_39322 [Tritrichomonas foetus]|eukprot:OHS94529.1 hypothetical protein TRFO_39322 [Tritrichomonas foetus]